MYHKKQKKETPIKILIILSIIIITKIFALKTVSVKINNYKHEAKFKVTYTNIENITKYIQYENKNFYLKNEYPKGKKHTAEIKSGKYKEEIKTKYENYKIYNLTCLKENNVYFDCIGRD